MSAVCICCHISGYHLGYGTVCGKNLQLAKSTVAINRRHVSGILCEKHNSNIS